VSHLRVPEAFAALVYSLRHHIRLVRERLERPPDAIDASVSAFR
jgi:hypothetical protein